MATQKAKEKEEKATDTKASGGHTCPNCGFNLDEHTKLVKEHHGAGESDEDQA